ncbi:C6 transcription factor [Apiospora kogelbergensis]|uniref:C6 transcription factor n=1 Tax=Apiospora kogelbergensis TaxID=1337665 RepID=A0AAW0QLK4_9PEZI
MSTSVKLRSSRGCWTCRLRRKKCDEGKPICSECGSLEITCHFGDDKPDWLDGGEREKQKAQELKQMVKDQATKRRDRKWAQLEDTTTTTTAPAVTTAGRPSPPQEPSSLDVDRALTHGMANLMDLDDSHEGYHPSADRSSSSGRSSMTPATSVSDMGSHPDQQLWKEYRQVAHSHSRPNDNGDSDDDDEAERELNQAMLYIDNVFPFLSPFYRPQLSEGGRGWLLVLLMKNKALFHTALSLASYFTAVVMAGWAPGEHEDCKMHNWRELQKQQALGIQALQQDLERVNARGLERSSLKTSVRCLEGIVQALYFEVAVANTQNWQVHLSGASVLFEQIIRMHASDNDAEKPWFSVLASMSPLNMTVDLGHGRHPWAPSQAAFRFMTAGLLWNDIIASTALGRAPSLQQFHAELLEGPEPALRTEEFVGCPNWVVLLISEISTLDAWKKEMKASGLLSVAELVRRASCIERRLRSGIAQLDPALVDYRPHLGNRAADDRSFAALGVEALQDFYKLHTTPSHSLSTRIWAHSALLYLSVVVSGLQPCLPEIRAGVTDIIAMFQVLPSPLCLRTLVWPYAVAGCLAMPDQEASFRDLIEAMGVLQIFGAVKEALEIMSLVWQHRACTNPDTWDIAACFKVLGHTSLLV